MLGAILGLKAVIITSPKCSKEKMSAIKAYGATLLVENDYMAKEVTLAKENPDWLMFDQYNNQLNSEAHYLTTGREIWEQTNGEVTHFVMSASTGGTISGVGRYLKEKKPNAKIILADPYGSVFHQFHYKGTTDKPTVKTEVEGAGKESLTGVIDFKYIDDVVQVHDENAFAMCKELASSEGLLVGGSAGLNAFAAIRLAQEVEEPCTIVTILCDMGIKYLSKIYDDDWLQSKNLRGDRVPA
jgi:cysteine synthase